MWSKALTSVLSIGPAGTIIICTRNRADSLSRTLAVKSLDISAFAATEIIVVDNGSQDHTAEVLTKHVRDFPFTFKVIHEARSGLSFARNAGINAARGDFIEFTDDDCLVSSDWLAVAWNILDGDLRQLVGGSVVVHNPLHLAISIKTDAIPEKFERPDQVFGFLLGANMVFGRRITDEIGLLDTRFGAAEDTDFAYRSHVRGILALYEPSLIFHHNHGRTTHSELCHLTYGYAIGTGALVAKQIREGRRDLLRPLYWDIRSALRNAIARPALWPLLIARAGFIVGAVRFTRLWPTKGPA